MHSTLEGDGVSRLMIQASNHTQLVILTGLSEANRHYPVSLFQNNGDPAIGWWLALSITVRAVVYFALLALLAIVICMILNCLDDCDLESETETDPLLPVPATAVRCTYGTQLQEGGGEDMETGNCGGRKCWSEDLYDGKLCVICYEQRRSCFFVPCGHSATCCQCAHRIYDGERRACPVCRKFIRKIRKLFA
ncbi:E3 ubiquitin-protein ligase APD3-like [Malania oleifera]|uniref:E3 ubiquitin-protein ligase APD3-like n=1 Tax=Malania oleifera TaxID=397392 RepID=UPI0025AE32C2|nr:E3 ubiquitin-protein ligase APD3-like [Malania oleifera]